MNSLPPINPHREALVHEARSLIEKKKAIDNEERKDELSIEIMQLYAQIDKMDKEAKAEQ